MLPFVWQHHEHVSSVIVCVPIIMNTCGMSLSKHHKYASNPSVWANHEHTSNVIVMVYVAASRTRAMCCLIKLTRLHIRGPSVGTIFSDQVKMSNGYVAMVPRVMSLCWPCMIRVFAFHDAGARPCEKGKLDGQSPIKPHLGPSARLGRRCSMNVQSHRRVQHTSSCCMGPGGPR